MESLTTTSNDSGPVLFGPTGAIVSRAPQPPKNVGFWEQIRLYVDLVSKVATTVWSVLLTVWSLLLTVGGVIFLVYFWSIEFMPEFDLKASVALLAASAVTGSILLIMVGFYLLVPGWMWVWWILKNKNLKSLWYKGQEFLPRRAAQWFSLPLVGFIAGVFLPLDLLGWKQWSNISFFGGILASLLVAIWFLWRKLQEKKGSAIGIFCISFVGSTWIFIWLILLIDWFIGTNPDLRQHARFFVPSAVLVILGLNTLVVVFGPFSFSWVFISRYFIGVALALVFVFGVASRWTFIPNRVMDIYKFGHVNNASLVLNEEGCTIAKYHGFQELTSLKEHTCRLECVMIHSRLVLLC